MRRGMMYQDCKGRRTDEYKGRGGRDD